MDLPILRDPWKATGVVNAGLLFIQAWLLPFDIPLFFQLLPLFLLSVFEIIHLLGTVKKLKDRPTILLACIKLFLWFQLLAFYIFFVGRVFSRKNLEPSLDKLATWNNLSTSEMYISILFIFTLLGSLSVLNILKFVNNTETTKTQWIISVTIVIVIITVFVTVAFLTREKLFLFIPFMLIILFAAIKNFNHAVVIPSFEQGGKYNQIRHWAVATLNFALLATFSGHLRSHFITSPGEKDYLTHAIVQTFPLIYATGACFIVELTKFVLCILNGM